MLKLKNSIIRNIDFLPQIAPADHSILMAYEATAAFSLVLVPLIMK